MDGPAVKGISIDFGFVGAWKGITVLVSWNGSIAMNGIDVVGGWKDVIVVGGRMESAVLAGWNDFIVL